MDSQQNRFALVTRGHHFLMEVLPFRHPESLVAVEAFVTAARQSLVPLVELEAILLRCLNVLSAHTAKLPTLVDRYLFGHHTVNCLERFKACVEQAINYEGIDDGCVQDAIRIIDNEYANTGCTPRYIASRLGMRLAALDVKFLRFARSTLTQRIRTARLNAAAILLATSNKAIKEIWVDVGYRFHSNFDHNFKHRFGVTPKAYRQSTLRPAARELFRERAVANVPPSSVAGSRAKAHVLIVDDDDATVSTLATSLRLQGHSVSSAGHGAEALAIVGESSPDAMLIDYHLEDMDGLALLRSIRETLGDRYHGAALFTADWDILDRAPEVADLDAIIASKLCDLEQVNDLIIYLISPHALPRSAHLTTPTRLPLL